MLKEDRRPGDKDTGLDHKGRRGQLDLQLWSQTTSPKGVSVAREKQRLKIESSKMLVVYQRVKKRNYQMRLRRKSERN